MRKDKLPPFTVYGFSPGGILGNCFLCVCGGGSAGGPIGRRKCEGIEPATWRGLTNDEVNISRKSNYADLGLVAEEEEEARNVLELGENWKTISDAVASVYG